MNTDFIVLANRIRETVSELEQVIARVERGIRAAKRHQDDVDLYIDAIALNLHDFYSGLERVFRQIGSIIDRSTPASEGWHRDLLNQMCLDLPTIRPRVLSEQTCAALEDFLRFRHIVRNVYAFRLDGDRVNQLAQKARALHDQIAAELHAFADYLEQVGRL
jgi:hypothetical protein